MNLQWGKLAPFDGLYLVIRFTVFLINDLAPRVERSIARVLEEPSFVARSIAIVVADRALQRRAEPRSEVDSVAAYETTRRPGASTHGAGSRHTSSTTR
jgi:hypothetical protein